MLLTRVGSDGRHCPVSDRIGLATEANIQSLVVRVNGGTAATLGETPPPHARATCCGPAARESV
jgi:hypothetical protein